MIESEFFAVLSSASAISSIVGTNIFPLELPTDPTLPAIDYRIIGGSNLPTLTTSGVFTRRVEVNCWGSTYASAVTLRAAVVAVLNGYSDSNMTITLISPSDFFEHELLQYRCMAEFYIYSTQ